MSSKSELLKDIVFKDYEQDRSLVYLIRYLFNLAIRSLDSVIIGNWDSRPN